MVLFLFSISLEVYKPLQQTPTQTVFPDRSAIVLEGKKSKEKLLGHNLGNCYGFLIRNWVGLHPAGEVVSDN